MTGARIRYETKNEESRPISKLRYQRRALVYQRGARLRTVSQQASRGSLLERNRVDKESIARLLVGRVVW